MKATVGHAFAVYHLPFLFRDNPLPPSLNKPFAQPVVYEQEKPLPFLPDSWRNQGKTIRPFVFVWGGRQIASTEFDVEK